MIPDPSRESIKRARAAAFGNKHDWDGMIELIEAQDQTSNTDASFLIELGQRYKPYCSIHVSSFDLGSSTPPERVERSVELPIRIEYGFALGNC